MNFTRLPLSALVAATFAPVATSVFALDSLEPIVDDTPDLEIVIQKGQIIRTTGTGQPAIKLGTNATNVEIINRGTLETTGNRSDGIRAEGEGSRVINFGSILTKGGTVDNAFDRSLGIWTEGAHSEIINYGSIKTLSQGQGSHGIQADKADTKITNRGKITTEGQFAYGILVPGADTQIINLGIIRTLGNFGDGILVSGANAYITNRGTISTSGEGARGILAAADNAQINNSGTIESKGDNAFAISGGLSSTTKTTQTLNILPGSRILGRIDLRAGDDIANISGSHGSAALTFDSADSLTINLLTDNAVNLGNVGDPNTSTVLVVDPTRESVMGNTLSTITTGAHQVINNRIQNNTPTQPIRLASAGQSTGLPASSSEPMVWGQFFGYSGERGGEGMVQRYDHDHRGVVFGFERNASQVRQGLLLGFVKADTKSATHTRDTNSFFIGAYGHTDYRSVTLSGSVLIGYEQHDSTRWVLDNLNGEETARSSSSGQFISPALTMSTNHALSEHWELRPSATLAYTFSRNGGYTETGTTHANLEVSSRNVSALTTRLQLEGVGQIQAGEIYLRAGLQSRQTSSGNIKARVGGNQFQFGSQSSSDATGGFIGVGINWHLNERYRLVADIETGRLSGSEKYHRGQLSFQYWF